MSGTITRIVGSCVALALASVAGAQGAPTAGNKPKLICKRSTETGSLVAKRKECKTRAEWDRQAQIERAAGERLIDDNRPRFGLEPPI